MNRMHWLTLGVGIALGYFIVPPILGMLGVGKPRG